MGREVRWPQLGSWALEQEGLKGPWVWGLGKEAGREAVTPSSGGGNGLPWGFGKESVEGSLSQAAIHRWQGEVKGSTTLLRDEE